MSYLTGFWRFEVSSFLWIQLNNAHLTHISVLAFISTVKRWYAERFEPLLSHFCCQPPLRRIRSTIVRCLETMTDTSRRKQTGEQCRLVNCAIKGPRRSCEHLRSVFVTPPALCFTSSSFFLWLIWIIFLHRLLYNYSPWPLQTGTDITKCDLHNLALLKCGEQQAVISRQKQGW